MTIEQSYLEKGGELWQKLQRQRDSLDIAKRSYLKQLCEEHPESLFSKLVGATIRPIYSSQEEQKNHFFDNIDFSDPVVVRSSILPSAMMEFFQLHTEYNEGGFQRSIDKILGLASAHDEVYEFCLNFILDLFNRVGPDIVFQYVVETYLLDGGCSEANVSEHISALAENYRVLQTGNKAPFFIATTIDNDSFVLEQHLSKNKYTVLFFWSSHCAFCTETTPQLIDWKKQNPNVSVVGISLDNNKEELDKYLTKKTVPWENICDYKGWKSDIVLQYKIHKTPSFYVLDSKGVIVSKPKDMSTLSRLNMDKVK
ncbi:MAG: thioredoxin family protein [Flavobacteriales bacterium]|nr:thioredoxin family protein [Flavobacteriales bacterium]